MNEIETLKRAFGKACDGLDHATLAQLQANRERLDRDEVFIELYYGTHPNANIAPRCLERRQLALFAKHPDVAQALAPYVSQAIDAAVAYNEARANVKAHKAQRPARSGYWAANGGHPHNKVYSFSTQAEPVRPEDIKPGDYLLVTFGKGTQLIYVQAVTGKLGLNIQRLNHRGTRVATWVAAWISRADRRILGLTLKNSFDPNPNTLNA